MKLNKKFLSCFLAGTMVMAPMSAYAEPSTTITGDGTVKDLETEIYNVILPTSSGIAFTVDPFGLLTTTNGTDLATVISNAAGSVTSSATAVVNKSSVDIDVSITSWVTVSGATLKMADTEAAAKSSADLYLAITEISGASITAVTAGSTSLSGSATAGTLDHEMYPLTQSAISGGTLVTSKAVAVTKTTSADVQAYTKSLANAAKAYSVSGGVATFDTSKISDYAPHSYVFVITGYANPESDVWKDLAKSGSELQLNMKFTLSSASGVPTYSEDDTITVAQGDSVTAKFASATGSTVSKVWFGKTSVAMTTDGDAVTFIPKAEGECWIEFADGSSYKVIIDYE